MCLIQLCPAMTTTIQSHHIQHLCSVWTRSSKKFKISNTIHWLNLWVKSISNPYWFVVWRKLCCWYVLLRWNVFSRIMSWSPAIIHIHLQVKQHFHLAYIKIRWYLAHLFQNMKGKCNSYWILYNSCCFDIGCLLSLLRFLRSAF